MKKNIIWIISILFLLIITLSITQFAGFSTGTIKFDNGRQGWTTLVTISNLDNDPAEITFSRTELERTAKNEGTELRVEDSERVQISLNKKQCKYSVTSLYSLSNNGIYKITNPKADIDLKINTVNYPSETIIPASSIQHTKVLNRHNNAEITATIYGTDTSDFCYMGDNMRAVKLFGTTTVIDMDKVTKAGLATSPPVLLLALVSGNFNIYDIRDTNFYREMKDVNFDGTNFQASTINNLARVQVLITADKDYFNVEPVATQNLVGDPVIITTECPELQSGKKSSGYVIIKNNGNNADIELQITGDNADPTIPTFSKYIRKNEQKTYPFTILPSEVSSKEKYTLTFKAISSQQLGGSNIDIVTCSNDLNPPTILLTPILYCGDGKCTALESAISCPEDCNREVCSPSDFEVLNEDTLKCECVEGYQRDEEGNCAPPSNINMYIILGIIAFFILFALIIVRYNKTSRRSYPKKKTARKLKL